MKKRRFEGGGEIDELEEANKRTENTLTNPNAKEYGESGTSYTTKATPKPASKPAPKAAPKAAPKSEARAKPDSDSMDETKMSLAERAKMSRERARAGSGSTDTRSVGERIRSALGAGKNRGGNSVDFGGSGLGMKSGGAVSSASRRADGIATKGKTRCKIC